jgi:5-methyltetrahydrofolate--homocysteine methyltransferase
MNDIVEAVLQGKLKEIGDIVQAVLDGGADPDAVLADGLVNAMDVVAERWKAGEMFVPEVLRSAKTMQTGMDVLKPHLVGGAAKGDLHDIGKNLVAMMLEGAGFEIIDLGVDVAPEAFVEAVQEGASLIGMSALLTTTMSNMGATIEALKTAGLRDKVKVMVGGAPVTEDFANSIGADAFAPDASSATRIARQLSA